MAIHVELVEESANISCDGCVSCDARSLYKDKKGNFAILCIQSVCSRVLYAFITEKFCLVDNVFYLKLNLQVLPL